VAQYRSKTESYATPSEGHSPDQLSGQGGDAAFSPDGNQLAYAWNGEKGDNFDIYVQLIGAGPPLHLTHHPDAEFSPAWSPDGRTIAFVRESETSSGVFLIPALGGHERKLAGVTRVTSVRPPHLAWTPDGASLIIVDKASPEEQHSLFLLSVETGERRRLTSSPRPYGDSGPAVSPDGKTVAFFRHSDPDAADVYIVPLAGGEPKRLTFFNAQIHGLTWTADGREIIFSSYQDRAEVVSLWRVETSGGRPEEVKGIGENLSFPSVARRGNRLACVQSISKAAIWRVEVQGSGHQSAQPEKFIPSTRNDQAPQYSPDGKRVAFVSDRSGKDEFWICDSEGHNAYSLSSGGKVGAYRWSPDSQRIAFITSGHCNIYAMNVDGGVPRQLTTERSTEVWPSWSRDGRWIYFGSDRSGGWQIWKIPSAGGQVTKVTEKGGFVALESPDARFLYYTKGFPSGPNSAIPGLWRMPVGGGEEVAVIETLNIGLGAYWDVVDNGIYFVETPSDHLASAPPAVLKLTSLATGRAREIALLEKPPEYWNQGLSASPDGHWVLYQGWDDQGRDIVMVENFR
jgi:Tol biopolymer transport system component